MSTLLPFLGLSCTFEMALPCKMYILGMYVKCWTGLFFKCRGTSFWKYSYTCRKLDAHKTTELLQLRSVSIVQGHKLENIFLTLFILECTVTHAPFYALLTELNGYIMQFNRLFMEIFLWASIRLGYCISLFWISSHRPNRQVAYTPIRLNIKTTDCLSE